MHNESSFSEVSLSVQPQYQGQECAIVVYISVFLRLIFIVRRTLHPESKGCAALPALTCVSVCLVIPQKPSLHVVHIIFVAVEPAHNYHGEAEIRRDKHPFRTNVCLKLDSFQNYGG